MVLLVALEAMVTLAGRVGLTVNVFEAVALSERVLVMGPRPGRLVAELAIEGPPERGLAFRHSADYAAQCVRVSQALHAATFGSFHAAAIGVIHKLFRGRHQARGQAIYGSLAFGLGGAIGGFASGPAWAGLGPSWTFTLSAGAAAVGLAVLVWKLRLGDQ